MQRLKLWLLDGNGQGSGPRVAWLFQRALAAIQLVAFASLAVQVQPLIGSRGILPWAPAAASLANRGVGWLEAPSLLRILPGDLSLTILAWLGVGLAGLALLDIRPRWMLGLNAILYLSFVTAGRDFFTFQWDALLIESSLLAIFLPTDKPARWVHLLFRVLLFKLYFESGIAKWMSGLHDWRNGEAMTRYYETAPLPTRLAFYAHHLPASWHHLESWGTLVLELAIPFLIFGPRPTRRFAFVTFSLFQLADILTANYGFFCYLALALGLFLLDERDFHFTRPSAIRGGIEHPALIVPVMSIYLFFSTLSAAASFEPDTLPDWAIELHQAAARFWAINVFHLFGAITTERIEPSFETLSDGMWTAQTLRDKPGPASRPPPFVAPHQPRLDFQLWFYGLRARARPPSYVVGLLQRLCEDPNAVQAFFTEPLPRKPVAVRIQFARYTFASLEEKRATSAFWHVEPLGDGPMLDCAAFSGDR